MRESKSLLELKELPIDDNGNLLLPYHWLTLLDNESTYMPLDDRKFFNFQLVEALRKKSKEM